MAGGVRNMCGRFPGPMHHKRDARLISAEVVVVAPIILARFIELLAMIARHDDDGIFKERIFFQPLQN